MGGKGRRQQGGRGRAGAAAAGQQARAAGVCVRQLKRVFLADTAWSGTTAQPLCCIHLLAGWCALCIVLCTPQLKHPALLDAGAAGGVILSAGFEACTVD